jgi:hypothetical protein
LWGCYARCLAKRSQLPYTSTMAKTTTATRKSFFRRHSTLDKAFLFFGLAALYSFAALGVWDIAKGALAIPGLMQLSSQAPGVGTAHISGLYVGDYAKGIRGGSLARKITYTYVVDGTTYNGKFLQTGCDYGTGTCPGSESRTVYYLASNPAVSSTEPGVDAGATALTMAIETFMVGTLAVVTVRSLLGKKRKAQLAKKATSANS